MFNIKHTNNELKILQALPLDIKIRKTEERIKEWYKYYNGDVFVSFSGGKDSTVLLHIARTLYPDIQAVYVDTGLEYPEIKEFVKTFDNVNIIYPKMNFTNVITKYGYPIVSKEVAQKINTARNKIKHNQDMTVKNIPAKWKPLIDADFNTSAYCCQVMKKNPMNLFQKENNVYPITAMMAEESELRTQVWLEHGCNLFDTQHPKSNPMSFWTEQDVLRYIYENNLKYASVYGELIKIDNKFKFTGAQRTGCMFCGFGCQFDKEPNRFQKMKNTHPKLYDYCINGGEYNEDNIWQPNKHGLGMSHVLDFINIDYKEPIKIQDIISQTDLSLSDKVVNICKAKRKELQLTHKEFADLIGVSQRTIDYWESGKKQITDINTIDNILKIFNISLTIGQTKAEGVE